jgi:hypothetical protein
MGLFATGKMGKISLGGFQLAADDADSVGSFNTQGDAVSRDPIDNYGDVSTNDETFTNFATENQHGSFLLALGAPGTSGQDFISDARESF